MGRDGGRGELAGVRMQPGRGAGGAMNMDVSIEYSYVEWRCRGCGYHSGAECLCPEQEVRLRITARDFDDVDGTAQGAEWSATYVDMATGQELDLDRETRFFRDHLAQVQAELWDAYVQQRDAFALEVVELATLLQTHVRLAEESGTDRARIKKYLSNVKQAVLKGEAA
jgi:hypothetical protein